jgi:glycine oxidase
MTKTAMALRVGGRWSADVVVIGGGLIGLTIALEMRRRGARVCVVERGLAMGQASRAAAGMLAVHDPGNPAELLPLAQLSVAMYPEFLSRIEALSGVAVPFQTEATLQYAADGGVVRLAEWSVDPRQLAKAVVGAVRATSIELLEETRVESVSAEGDGIRVATADELSLWTQKLVYAAGAWTRTELGVAIPVVPRKGQMLRVRLPGALTEVHRSDEVYVVPRTLGEQAGTAVIGATIEDVGFDVSVWDADLRRLREMAAEMVPGLGSERNAPMVEAWAGLRPAVADGLPVMGRIGEGREFVATGHYRNGVMLAPATAEVMADVLMGSGPAVDLAAFSAGRFKR